MTITRGRIICLFYSNTVHYMQFTPQAGQGII